MKKIFIFIVLIIIAGFIAIKYVNNNYAPGQALLNDIQRPISTNPGKANGANPPASTTPPTTTPTKTTLNLSVPFTPQAPRGNWDTIHNEDCEEASSIMANAYFNGPHNTKLDATYVEGQLTKLTDWEMKNFGYNLDISSEETIKMIEANFGLHAKIVTDFSEDTIKKELQQNHIVLLPVNGQLIANPNYKAPGPKYHVLLIRGYTSSSIITNDSGTRNGLNYSYSYNTLYNANGSWSHQSNSVDLNKKNIIVVWK
jgi:hypothetical protein